jgi:hypothetical protein
MQGRLEVYDSVLKEYTNTPSVLGEVLSESIQSPCLYLGFGEISDKWIGPITRERVIKTDKGVVSETKIIGYAPPSPALIERERNDKWQITKMLWSMLKSKWRP